MPDELDMDREAPPLRCGIVLRVEEDVCQVLIRGKVISVRYAPLFPTLRLERVSPVHLVAIAQAPGGAEAVVWRWYDAVVLGVEAGSVRLWESGHGEILAERRRPRQRYDPGTRAYLSSGLPGAEWWVAGRAAAVRSPAWLSEDQVDAELCAAGRARGAQRA